LNSLFCKVNFFPPYFSFVFWREKFFFAKYFFQKLLIDAKKPQISGGNPGGASQVRLDDFWKLKLEKPSRDHILNYCKYLIRKQHYEELSKVNRINALRYLQTELFETINKTDASQLSEFHKLASFLFRTNSGPSEEEATNPNLASPTTSEISTDDSCSSLSTTTEEKSPKLSLETRNQRNLLFNKLIELLPEELCQPRSNLIDLI
jgi:hypothetical protein